MCTVNVVFIQPSICHYYTTSLPILAMNNIATVVNIIIITAKHSISLFLPYSGKLSQEKNR